MSATWKTARDRANTLKMLGDPTRLAVLGILVEKPHNVNELCAALSAVAGGHQAMSQPAVSHHLALLKHSRLVEPIRQGKFNFYSLTEQGQKLVAGLVAVA